MVTIVHGAINTVDKAAADSRYTGSEVMLAGAAERDLEIENAANAKADADAKAIFGAEPMPMS